MSHALESTEGKSLCSFSTKRRVLLLVLAVFLQAGVAVQAEAPHAVLRPFAPGGIAIDWEHPNDGASGIVLEREDPAFTWAFAALVNSYHDLGLQAGRIYRYRVCAVYGALDCTPWLAARTLEAPTPASPREVPRFTTHSSTADSITVHWTSTATYDFHQVRWAANGRPDGQNKVNGRSFTAERLLPGTYHFIVQGCDHSLFSSSCSHFSPPIEVTVQPPRPLEVANAVTYAVAANGDLLWYRHDGRSVGSFTWAPGAGKQVGNGWDRFSTVFSGGNGVIYAIEEASRDMRTGQPIGGHLVWYRHDGWRNGGPAWVGPKIVGNRWQDFSTVFSAGDGVIYGVTAHGDLLWYRHDGRSEGTFTWAPGAGKKVGNGWGRFSTVFSGGNGVIYAIEEASRDMRTGQPTGGRLLWYRHDGWRDGSNVWVGPEVVDRRWSHFSKVYSGGDGVIYAIAANGDLLWHYHDGWRDGSSRWAEAAGKKIGVGWSGFSEVIATPSCGFGLEGNPC